MTQKWMECVVHQVNTALKSCFTALEGHEDLSKIPDDFVNTKHIIRSFKQSGMNGGLPNGYHQIQESETRLASSFSAVQRFIESGNIIYERLQDQRGNSACSSMIDMEKEFIWI